MAKVTQPCKHDKRGFTVWLQEQAEQPYSSFKKKSIVQTSFTEPWNYRAFVELGSVIVQREVSCVTVRLWLPCNCSVLSFKLGHRCFTKRASFQQFRLRTNKSFLQINSCKVQVGFIIKVLNVGTKKSHCWYWTGQVCRAGKVLHFSTKTS